MTGPTVLAAACLAASALAVALPGAPVPIPGAAARRRLRLVLAAPGPAGPSPRAREGDGLGPPGRRRRGLRRDLLAGCAAAGVTVLLVGGWWGLLAGCLVGPAVHLVLRRWAPAPDQRERAVVAASLPLVLDLLAAAYEAGAPVAAGIEAVGGAVGGAAGDRCVRIGRALRLGASPEEAWQPLVDLPAGRAVLAAVARSGESGAAVAPALRRIVADLRLDAEAAGEARAARASVLVVLPLGACFLPAFVLVGVVPLVAGVLSEAL